MNEIKIIITDDHHLVAQGLVALLETHSQFKVLDCLQDGETLLRKLKTVTPDLVILDLRMPGMNGLEVAREVKANYPHIKVLCVSAHFDRDILRLIQKAGADGFIHKMDTSKKFIETIHAIMNGEKVFTDTHSKPGLNSGTLEGDSFTGQVQLTTREIEILKLIKKGKTTEQLAEELNVSFHTIETHRRNICKKLNLHNPNSLVKFANTVDI